MRAATTFRCRYRFRQYISIHAAHAGSDGAETVSVQSKFEFQSTLPEWAATDGNGGAVHHQFISIHAARVGSDLPSQRVNACLHAISIHAARVGSDGFPSVSVKPQTAFQSTLPEWAATDYMLYIGIAADISIHAARVGSDMPRGGARPNARNVNPRCPSGQRPCHFWNMRKTRLFQSTLPEWAATNSG